VAPSYGYPQYGYAVPATTGTNGFAIASLVCAFLCSPLGLIFGFIARNQIKRTGEGGAGLALAGIIISIAAIVIGILYFVLVVTIIGTHINNGTFTFPTQTP
jgi:peptidyl-prolyl cis-trans isomerase B (cyclophilin B)